MNATAQPENEAYPSQAVLDELTENSKTLRGLFTVVLVAGLYIFLSTENVTHRQLFNPEAGMSLPQIGIKHDVVSFFWSAPLILVLAHLYFLLHTSNFIGSLRRVEKECRKRKKAGGKVREDWKDLVHPSMLAIVVLNRKSAGRPTRWIMTQFVVFTHYYLMIPVLLRIQIKFLPYHHPQITSYMHKPLVIMATMYCAYFLWEFYLIRIYLSQKNSPEESEEERLYLKMLLRAWKSFLKRFTNSWKLFLTILDYKVDKKLLQKIWDRLIKFWKFLLAFLIRIINAKSKGKSCLIGMDITWNSIWIIF